MSYFEGDKFLIVETTHWKVFLMSDQTYLGRSVVVLKREECGDLADLTNEEVLDFLGLVKKLENSFRKAFASTMFNWSCLMNWAYKNNPPTPHVHWHFRPRYDHKVEFAGLEFVDDNFGEHYEWGTDRDVGEVRIKIVNEVKKYL